MTSFDVIIIGSGIAALTAAYKLSLEKNVIIITKSKCTKSNSILAQGGVASSMDENDTCFSHYTDTMTAGCYHNQETAVETLVEQGPSYLSTLIQDGMKFDVDEFGNLLLGKEGAHSRRRILHAGGDATGRELIHFMLEKVKNSVQIIEDEMVVDLTIQQNKCIGVQTMTTKETIKQYFGTNIVLATGGCGALYSYTSNDDSITGDGLALAYRAGAKLTDLEFIQFHPTLLNIDGKGCGLISEAVRGEGAFLVSEDGSLLMKNIHPLEDLAPRDIVARRIFREIVNHRQVFLDISMISSFKRRFPTITYNCRKYGIQVENGLLPVIPGAHFLMGGVKTDTKGRTSIDGLYAVGEVACTGVHGANRLASNSLLEGIVYGNIVAKDILTVPSYSNTSLSVSTIKHVKQTIASLPSKQQIQQMMMENVGIVRNKKRLKIAIDWFEEHKRLFDGISMTALGKEQITIANMLTVGWLIATSALSRTESRGGHFREDYPYADNDQWFKREIVREVEREFAI